MTATTDEIDVAQFANDTVRLTVSLSGLLHSPKIVEGEVSGTGKTITASKPNSEKTVRLDTARIMAGEFEVRDSWGYTLYTPEGFQGTQRANHSPGAQMGSNGPSDTADLPEPTHEPMEA